MNYKEELSWSHQHCKYAQSIILSHSWTHTFSHGNVLTVQSLLPRLAGLVLGDFHTGIVMGAALESIFMGISAIGGSIPADATTASIIAVAYTILTGSTAEAGLAIALPTYRNGFNCQYVYTFMGFISRLLGKACRRMQS